MRLHRNARTCPASRRLICVRVLEQGWSLAQAAEACGVRKPVWSLESASPVTSRP
jgi:hypothetical protein